MKIIENQSAVLSNFEVLSHIEATRAKPRVSAPQHTNVETVLKEVTDYLDPKAPVSEREPVSPIPPFHEAGWGPSTIRELITRLKPFNLAKAEVMMILNLRPQALGLLDCIIEECDDRFSEEQQTEILGIIRDVLGGSEEGEEMEVDGAEEGERVNGVGH